MGQAENNEHVPFQIDYVTSIENKSSALQLINPTHYKCNEVAEVSTVYYKHLI
jgi:hypothetical protein